MPIVTPGVFFLIISSAFMFWQEILQHGRSFEVEKALSDERYQTLKVSKCERSHSLTFSSLMLLNCCESDLHFLS